MKSNNQQHYIAIKYLSQQCFKTGNGVFLTTVKSRKQWEVLIDNVNP